MKKVNLVDRCIKYLDPCDYERFIQKLYDLSAPKYVRKIKAWKFMTGRYFKYKINKDNPNFFKIESQELFRKDNLQYIEKLMKYDIVSFDMFDTLILREIIDSSDVFYLVGMKLQVKGFKEIRKRAEEEARKRFVANSTYDVKLRDIYTILHEWYNIDIEAGMKAELEVEKALCVANPYWYPVFKELIRRGKKVIITTDMYMSEQDLESILESKGYTGQERMYVSCELNVSKRNGKMFELIQNDLGNDSRYIHIGDHEIFDYKMAQVKGWNAIYYLNVHWVGKACRKDSKSSKDVIDCISDGILDVALYNGVTQYESSEKFGFNNLGRVYVEYFQQLEKFAEERNVDKLLFIQSSGQFLINSYRKFFGNICSDYIDAGRIKLDVFTDKHKKINVSMEEYFNRMIHNCKKVCIVDVDRGEYAQRILRILKECTKWPGEAFAAPSIDDRIYLFWKEINRNDEIMIKTCQGVLEYIEEYRSLEKRLGLRLYLAEERTSENKS